MADNMDNKKAKLMDILNNHYQEKDALKWFNYWRVFFMSCEELWRFNKGNEWFIGHYLMSKRKFQDERADGHCRDRYGRNECGLLLQDKYDLTIFEKNDYVGGHTNTITVESELEKATFDTVYGL